jgi:hypothetical protein
MTTTTQITTTTILDIENVDWGGHEAEFDLDAIKIAYRDAIQELLPAGVTLALNGQVFAEVRADDDVDDTDEFPGTGNTNSPRARARRLDRFAWAELAESVDFWAIAERHQL